MREKIFFDCEFTGLHRCSTLISIGLVHEKGATFYAEFADYDRSKVDDWIQAHVINNLLLKDFPERYTYRKNSSFQVRGVKEEVANALLWWIYSLHNSPSTINFDVILDFPPSESLLQDVKYEMWSDCLAYDWVLFCDLWGTALDLPKCFYYIPFDLSTLFRVYGIDPDISREEFAKIPSCDRKHNALWDAEVIKACYEELLKRRSDHAVK